MCKRYFFLFSKEIFESFNVYCQCSRSWQFPLTVVSRFFYLVPDGPCISILKAIKYALSIHRSTCFLGCQSGVAWRPLFPCHWQAVKIPNVALGSLLLLMILLMPTNLQALFPGSTTGRVCRQLTLPHPTSNTFRCNGVLREFKPSQTMYRLKKRIQFLCDDSFPQ